MGDALDFDVGIHEQGLGTLHADFLYISIDSAAVAALKEFGQVFLGKEIFVTDEKGRQRAEAKAYRDGEKITLEVNGCVGKPCFFLYGVMGAADVSGGTARAEEAGVRIVPDGTRVVVTVQA